MILELKWPKTRHDQAASARACVSFCPFFIIATTGLTQLIGIVWFYAADVGGTLCAGAETEAGQAKPKVESHATIEDLEKATVESILTIQTLPRIADARLGSIDEIYKSAENTC